MSKAGERFGLVAALLFAVMCAEGQLAEEFSTRSVSGQFIVQVAPGSEYSFAPANLETNRSFIRLDPTLVPVSCERIKQILWRELDSKPPYSGKVFLTLYPGRGADQPIAINIDPYTDGWRYRVILPNLVERVRYVRTIVQVVLLEMANRAATTHAAEVPAWLVEGLAQELLASREIEIILPPPNTPVNNLRLSYTPMDARRPNPLEHAHQVLAASPPLTFQQLSWPALDQLHGQAADLFSASAELFVHQLLEFRDGGTCLRIMLSELPRHYNWQLAFLDAFHSHFSRPLDVEKWWSLEVLHFTGRTLDDAWPRENSWQKLSDEIHSAVRVRIDTNELPLRAQITLQTVIREWDPARQPAVLEAKLQELSALRLRLSRDLIPLVDEYRNTIATYLQERHRTGLPFFRKAPSPRQTAAQNAIRQLDALDARLETLQPADHPAVEANARRTIPATGRER